VLLFAHMDARVGEDGRGPRVARPREPRGMVEVQVREDDMRDVARVDAELRERVDRGAALEVVHRALAVGPLVAAAGLDEDEPVARRLDEQRAGREGDAVVCVRLDPAGPHRLRDQAEHPAAVEAERAGAERLDARDGTGGRHGAAW